MVASLILGIIIFCYAAWILYNFIKKSKEGKCATCAIKNSCTSGCTTVSQEERQRILNIK